MLELGLHFGQGPLLLKNIANTEDISEKYLSQIIIPLKAAGLVKSFRGPHGGYVLGRPLKKIYMNEVYEILEGKIDLTGAARKNEVSLPSLEVTNHLWQTLGESMEDVLKNITLADLVKKCREKEESVVMYNI